MLAAFLQGDDCLMGIFLRTQMLIGEDGLQLLGEKHVAVFGVGGVGGAVCEALARAGVGELSLFDDDIVSESNINRQIIALYSTIGMPKVKVMADRIKDINPKCVVHANRVFYMPQNAAQYEFNLYDYVVDAVDTVSAKLEIIERAYAAGVPVISSMGTGNKIHPEEFNVTQIEKTSVCPLARVMRKELKKRGISGVKVVYSKEEPLKPFALPDEDENIEAGSVQCANLRAGKAKIAVPASISFVPPVAGFVLAGEVVRELLGCE